MARTCGAHNLSNPENLNPNSKIVQYSGTVTLAEGFPASYVLFTSFSLPFRMQFDRTLVSTP